MFSHTDNKLTVGACYEHGCFLFLGSLWLYGRHGFSWWGSEGNCQVAGVLGGSSRTGQSCGCGRGDGGATTIWYLTGGSVAHSNQLRRCSSGHNVDHRLLVALHAWTKLTQKTKFTYCGPMMHSSKTDNKHKVDRKYLAWYILQQTRVRFTKKNAGLCLTVNTKHSPVPKYVSPSESCFLLSITSVDRKAPKTWEMGNTYISVSQIKSYIKSKGKAHIAKLSDVSQYSCYLFIHSFNNQDHWFVSLNMWIEPICEKKHKVLFSISHKLLHIQPDSISDN